MAALADLRQTIELVEIDSGEVSVYPIRTGDLLDLMKKYSALGMALMTPGAGRVEAIVKAITASGKQAILDVIDISTRSEPGTAADAPLSGLDEFTIITRAVSISLPAEQMGKLMAEWQALAAQFGLDAAEEAPSES